MTSFFVKSSFPKAVFGNLLLLISIALFIATTDPRQKHSGMTAKTTRFRINTLRDEKKNNKKARRPDLFFRKVVISAK